MMTLPADRAAGFYGDYHTHTRFCDGRDDAAQLAARALKLGFSSLGFSGHAWTPYGERWSMSRENTALYRREIRRLQAEYRGRLEILLGCEFDLTSQDELSQYDYAIGSVHCLFPGGVCRSVDWSAEDFAETGARFYGGDFLALAEDYYRALPGLVSLPVQIVGHFDLVTKFNEGGRLFDEDSPRYRAAALDALHALADGGKLLFEINTGAVSRGFRSAPYPAPFLLRELARCGGRVILSSDSHRADTLGFGFAEARALAERCGVPVVKTPFG